MPTRLSASRSSRCRPPLPGNGTESPPLVLVTVSGGSIRASVWTATVLARLEHELGAAFPHHIRLITGASGGMVAAGHYVAGLQSPRQRSAGDGGNLEGWADSLAEDQLDSVVGCLVFNEISALLNPFGRVADRGQKIEEAWKRIADESRVGSGSGGFGSKFRDLDGGEYAGWHHSLVFAPMLVEDGRRLLISNLDLSLLAGNAGRLLLDVSERRLDPTHLRDLRPEAPAARDDDDLFSLSTIEFFRLFPDATEFEVGTAARMSAAFPLFAPAVCLPTNPPRRVVDAGYQDYYGVNVAAPWLTEHRTWLARNTSGVLVIQIRDGVSQEARTEIGYDHSTEAQAGSPGFLARLTRDALSAIVDPGSYPFSTPLQGFFSAREWSMSFRNDEHLELFDELANSPDDGSSDADFFRTIVFECPVAASTSWKLNPDETSRIRLGMGPDNLEAPNIRDFRLAEKKKIDEIKSERDEVERKRIRDGKSSPCNTSKESRLNWEYLGRFHEERVKVLRDIGYKFAGTGSIDENRKLYDNVLGNIRRRGFIQDWWGRRVPDGAGPPS